MTHYERRQRSRLRLRLPVLLLRTESAPPLWTETADISSNGFYCNTPEPFAPGEKLTCLIGFPGQPSGSPESTSQLYLEAKVDVVRIVVDNNGFGVGCHIAQYHVVPNDELPSWAAATAEQVALESVIEQLV